ncbi:hypothetical protein COV18_04255 [Candidatus Woesearchaeota archaeon CG10_big_fil_rev_8_21_14_0_10_37_12]|nr:MAG: hypothetical protein COV18_04255 [Candidatus Woesearchaeota archaeon CG10_big_fil_rev_8_21_14_0_10_37_12]
MTDKKIFQDMRKELETFDQLREQLITESREVIKQSKKAIYAAQRNSFKDAAKNLLEAKKQLSKLHIIAAKNAKLATFSMYQAAVEEYTEAALFIHYLEHKTVPSHTKLGVGAEEYICALSDMIGELVRKAVNSVITGKTELAIEIKDFVQDVYAELMLFDWRNSPTRKKFDVIKYHLEKLENLVLQIKMKE